MSWLYAHPVVCGLTQFVHMFLLPGSFEKGKPESCVKGASCWSHDRFVSLVMSHIHCDVIELPRQHHLPIIARSYVFTVISWSSDMEEMAYCDHSYCRQVLA